MNSPLLKVENLRKYFPIRGGVLQRVINNVKAVDDVSFEFVKGATVDYVEEMIRSSFAIAENPNSDGSCGCGVSFAAK